MTASRIAELEAALRSAQAFQTKLVELASRADYEREELEDKEAFNRFGATVAQWTYDGTFASYRDEFDAALSAPEAPEVQSLPASVEAVLREICEDMLDMHHGRQVPLEVDAPSFGRGAAAGWDAAISAFYKRTLASLTPAPTPACEAGGEPVAWAQTGYLDMLQKYGNASLRAEPIEALDYVEPLYAKAASEPEIATGEDEDDVTEAMWQAGRDADEHPGDCYTKVYKAMRAARDD